MPKRFAINVSTCLIGSRTSRACHRLVRPTPLPRHLVLSNVRSIHFPHFSVKPLAPERKEAPVLRDLSQLGDGEDAGTDEDAGKLQRHADSNNSSARRAESEQNKTKGTEFPYQVWRDTLRCLRALEGNASAYDVRKLRAYRRLAENLMVTSDAEEIRKRWIQIVEDPFQNVYHCIVGCLSLPARTALTALSTMGHIRGSFYIKADALAYLRRARWEEIGEDSELEQAFYHQLDELCDPRFWPPVFMTSQKLSVLLEGAGKEKSLRILQDYLDKYRILEESQILYLVDCYTRLGEADSALALLRRLDPDRLQEEQGEVLARCINLMNLETVDRTQDPYSLKILPQLLEMGVRPNVGVYNKAVQNAFDLELPNVAWDLFHFMQSQEILATSTTVLELLRSSFLSSNVSNLDKTMTMIHDQGLLRAENPYLVGYLMNIVRYICYFEKQSHPRESLAHLLAIYDKAWNRKALAKLKLIRHDQVAQGNELYPDPLPSTLAYVVWCVVYVQRREAPVTRLWQLINQMIEQGDKQVIEMAKHSSLFDGFMLFYSRNVYNLPKALMVLRYMLSKDCVPSGTSWSIMLCSMLKHEKYDAAELILKMMLERGVSLSITPDAWKVVEARHPDSAVSKKITKILEGKELPTEILESLKAAETALKNVTDALDADVAVSERTTNIWDAPMEFPKVVSQQELATGRGVNFTQDPASQ